MAAMQETHFRKNLAIMGGLLMLACSGPGKWALGRSLGKNYRFQYPSKKKITPPLFV